MLCGLDGSSDSVEMAFVCCCCFRRLGLGTHLRVVTSRHTEHEQSDLIPNSSLTELTRCILICAVGYVYRFNGEDAEGDGDCKGGDLQDGVDDELAERWREGCCSCQRC